MKNKIGWNEPKFGNKEIKLVERVLKSGYINEGPMSKELEEKIKDFLDVKYIALTTSGTAALFLGIKSDQIVRNLGTDYNVLVPDLTFIASANAVRLAGAHPILADIEKERLTINPLEAEKKVNKKTRAIIPVSILGRNCYIDDLEKIANENKLEIIEDACGSFGSRIKEGYLGTLGKVGCFSLQANKIISSGQGGFAVTNDERYFEVMKRIKDQGRFRRSEEIHQIEGYNFKFNDVLAAVALGQIKDIEKRKDRLINQRIIYEKELLRVNEVSFPYINYDEGEIPLFADVLVKNRKKLNNYLSENGICTRNCWMPLHRNPPYKNQGSDEDFPVSSRISKNYLWLPNGQLVTNKDIKYVCQKIKDFYSK